MTTIDQRLEICCGDIEAVIAAKEGGARRVELCAGLSDGGVTPSIALVKHAARLGIPNINVLIRPRPGDFLYTPAEVAVMEEDIRAVIAAGATGVVIGALNDNGTIDMAAMARLVNAVFEARGGGVNITFHRAFDVAADPEEALHCIIKLGCNCLLTSGMAPSAEKGVDCLRRLVELADGRIDIMAGAGIKAHNAAKIIESTGVQAIHSTARRPVESLMKFRRPEVPMGAPGSDEYFQSKTTARDVRELVDIVSRY